MIYSNDTKELKIAIMSPGFFKGDACGHSANDYYKALLDLGYSNVCAIGPSNNFEDMNFQCCHTSSDLRNNAWYQDSKIVIWHFPVYYDLFEILRSPDTTKCHVICFHNVTPKHLMPAGPVQEIIDKSFEQISLFLPLKNIWVVSRENREELLRRGIENDFITEIPISVDRPPLSTFLEKPEAKINIVCVGRFFASKGILDVIDAVALLRDKNVDFALRLIGNLMYSDAAYVNEVKRRVMLHGLGACVDFVGSVDEETLFFLYKISHIYVSGSYHEGFCVPVIESLRAGLIPVTYDAANLRWIAGGNGRTVPTGDIKALADALSDTCTAIERMSDDQATQVLELDSGKVSAIEFSKAATDYAVQFDFEHFKKNLQEAMLNLKF